MNIDVSVIVPVYNVEKYLEKCLDSLIMQTLESMEIIIVNDGSVDSSQLIIDRFIAENPNKNIVSLKTDNCGLGQARNSGLKVAKGSYIGFVDSDDWVDSKMFESMLGMAKKGFDIVICDFMVVQDGYDTGHIGKGFRGKNFEKKEIIINSLDPATACNKLYAKKFFDLIKFPCYWYEDMGTTPIYLSYATNIGYLEFPLYYYRQRKSSITYSADKRTLGVLDAWERILTHGNSQFKSEIEYAVYKSVSTFLEFKPEFADEFLDFARRNRQKFINNGYIQNGIRSKEVDDLLDKELIPKKLHYFWFGKGEKSELINHCIASWKKYASDYEIIEWNESNCNIYENQYVAEAYKAKKWAFVADYFRIKVIYEHGGIYVDTDVEITNKIDSLRLNNLFLEFETKKDVNAALFGAIPKHKLVKKLLNSYNKDSFLTKEGSYNISHTIVKRLTEILVRDYNIQLNGEIQSLNDGIKIYPPNILTINVFDGKNLAVHHYDASWWDVKEEVSYKNFVLKDYFYGVNADQSLQEVVTKYQQLIQTYENTLSWRITFPLRRAKRILKKIFNK